MALGSPRARPAGRRDGDARRLFALFFGLSALIVSGVEALGIAPPWLEWLLFAALGVALLLLLRKPVQARLQTRSAPMDDLVGEVAVPLEDLGPNATGKAELRGTSWTVRNAGETPLVRGQRCQVQRVDGLTLWIRPE